MSSPAYYDLPYRAVAHAHYVDARLRTVEPLAVNGEACNLGYAAFSRVNIAYAGVRAYGDCHRDTSHYFFIAKLSMAA